MTDKYIVLLKRGLRTFLAVIAGAFATAIGAITLELAKGETITSFHDLQQLGLRMIPIFSIAFFGAITVSIDKAARWKEPEQPQPIENEPTTKTSLKRSTSKSKA